MLQVRKVLQHLVKSLLRKILDWNFSDHLFCYLYLEEVKRSRKNFSSSLCWKSCLCSHNSENFQKKTCSWLVAFLDVNIHSGKRIGEGHIQAVLMGRADGGLYLAVLIIKP